MRAQRGRVSIVQILLLAALGAGLYGGFMYLPVLMHRMSMTDIARRYAARMLVDHDDGKIREEIFREAKEETGIEIGMSELLVERITFGPDIGTRITIKWTEQVKHVWGTNHVLRMAVTEKGTYSGGGGVIKNAQ